ncbi:hypothetical protein [Clostridium perfringens]|uniref:hypothetical protein n=1 Tax=Clostridium perfringens TaxID=1502 RepID=UPI0039EA7436
MKLVFEEGNVKEYECLGYYIQETFTKCRGYKLNISSNDKLSPTIYAIKGQNYNNKKDIVDFEISTCNSRLSSNEFKEFIQKQECALKLIEILKEKYIK